MRVPCARPVAEPLERRLLLTVLTFETTQARDSLVPDDYGDNARVQFSGAYHYGPQSGATPNVAVSYGAGVRTWDDDFGDLANVAFCATEAGGVLEITLSADPGYAVTLRSADLAGWSRRDYTVDAIRVFDGAGTAVFSAAVERVEGDSAGPGHTHVVFNNVTASSLTLRVDARSLLLDSDNVGIDNLEFGQTPSPGPLPDGYADRVLAYHDSGAGPRAGPYGGVGRDAPLTVSADAAVGAEPDARDPDFLSLPTGSSVVVEFADESVIDGPGDDLILREQDPAGDFGQVEVSADGVDFTLIGTAQPGSATGFDLAGLQWPGPVRFVRVTGLDNNGDSPGYDLIDVRAADGSIGLGPDTPPATKDFKRPIIVIPGIVGSMPAVATLPEFLVKPGHAPGDLVPDPILRVYDPLLTTLGRLGYERNRDLFVATYDWRRPIAPPAKEGSSGDDGRVDLGDVEFTDSDYDYGVEYLRYWVESARANSGNSQTAGATRASKSTSWATAWGAWSPAPFYRAIITATSIRGSSATW